MSSAKFETLKNGELLHFSVGALIEKDGKFLLIDRNLHPFGFACVAGHVDEGESPEVALEREVREECGLIVESAKLVAEEEVTQKNKCTYGVEQHKWFVFSCTVSGDLKTNEQEVKSSGWYTPTEIKELKVEPVWKYWLQKLAII